MRGLGRHRTTVLCVGLMVTLLVGAFVRAPVPAAAEESITVTWPEITAFNPNLTDYVIEVAGGDASSTYLLTGVDSAVEIRVAQWVHPGSNRVEFTGDGPGGQLALKLYQCDADQTNCRYVTQSTSLSVWQGIAFTSFLYRMGPATPLPMSVRGPGDLSTVDIDWQILDHGTAVASGTQSDISIDARRPPVGEQPQLRNGRKYQLEMRLTGESPTYGHLSSSAPLFTFVWDTYYRPRIRILLADGYGNLVPKQTVYPVDDDYGNWLHFFVSADDAGVSTIEIRNADGELVNGRRGWRRSGDGVMWAARDEDFNPLPEGRYTASISSTDTAGNAFATTRVIRVSHEQPVPAVWHARITPADSLDYLPVQRCGTITTPARARWPGSFGYRAPTSCSSRSYAQSYHRLPLPASAWNRYDGFRLSVDGGASRAAPASRLLYELDPFGGAGLLWGGPDFGPEQGTHTGPWEAVGVSIEDGHPTLQWTVAAMDGSRYDVKAFEVDVQYYVLGYPD